MLLLLLLIVTCWATKIIFQERDSRVIVSLFNLAEASRGSIFTTSCCFDRLASNQQTVLNSSGEPKVSTDAKHVQMNVGGTVYMMIHKTCRIFPFNGLEISLFVNIN